MSFRELTIKESYGTLFQDEDVSAHFYNPVLDSSVLYKRAAGYFSSRTFVAAASGIAGLVHNGGKMQLVTSHAFTKSDTMHLQDYFSNPQGELELYDSFNKSMDEVMALGSEIAKNHLQALCWMLGNGMLEVKIVIPKDADLTLLTPDDIDKFHPKFGIMFDKHGDKVAFSGSINETLNAWKFNVENFDVYKSWDDGQKAYIEPKLSLFEKYWSGQGLTDKWQTIELPSAVRDRIVNDYAPNDFPEWEPTISQVFIDGFARQYQEDAVEAWIDNGNQGILEMATGTGKTRTSRKIIEKCLAMGSLLTVVIVPYRHIGTQWENELSDQGAELVGGSNWFTKLQNKLFDIQLGRIENLTLVCVKNTASSTKFLDIVNQLAENFKNFLLIGDEVHWLGATSYQSAMNLNANLRLGLSATPKRYFDDLGTLEIYNYFGSKKGEKENTPVFKFDIASALAFRTPNGSRILTPYYYNPIFVKLTPAEQKNYLELFTKIQKLKNSKTQIPNRQQILEELYNQLADIAKSAENKIPALGEFLRGENRKWEQTIIYCADGSQMEKVALVLRDLDIDVQKITADEGALESSKFGGKSERQHILDNFQKGNLQVLLAIACLDEGVDIPSARVGIILASSGNSKEFIQRRGRLMRVYEGKEFAEIYDFCVLPDSSSTDAAAKKIINKELERCSEFGQDAVNKDQIEEVVKNMSVGA